MMEARFQETLSHLALLTLVWYGRAASADAAARVGEVWTRMADTVGRDSDWGTPRSLPSLSAPPPSTLLGVAPFPFSLLIVEVHNNNNNKRM